MANDLPDWSTSVQVTGGVTINGTATVAISGIPTVNINAGQSVAISGVATVAISGTPSVTISGTPTVQIATGSNVIGSVSAINSTVTVAGVVSISGTTTISGAVTITSGSVTISGTTTISGAVTVTSGSITVSGTVNIGNTPAVTISGTPAVTISSGTVNIGGTASINITSQSVNLSTQQPQVALANLSFPAGATNLRTTAVVPTGTHALILSQGAGSAMQNITVAGHTSGVVYCPVHPGDAVSMPVNSYLAVQVDSVQDTTFDVTATTLGSVGTMHVTAVLDTAAVQVGNNVNQPLYVRSPSLGQVGYPFEVQIIWVGKPTNVTNIGNDRVYRFAFAFTSVAAATDVVVISRGTATTLKVRRVWLQASAAAAALARVALILRSTNDTLGTFVADTRVPMDTTAAASLAAVGHYTANPTLGTAVGNLGTKNLLVNIAGNPPDHVEWDFTAGSGVVLNANADQLCVNLNGLAAAAVVVGEVEYTEA